MFAGVPCPENGALHPGDLPRPEAGDNVFRLTVVPIFAVGDQVLVVQRRAIPKKLHAWEKGFLGRDLSDGQSALQVIQAIATELGFGKIRRCTFVASHHERREHKKSIPPYTEFICTVCYLVTLPTTEGCKPTPHSEIAKLLWLDRTAVYDHLSYHARFWLPFELEEYLRFGVIGKPVPPE
ncbi:MAG TPA: hypothetical protein VES58_03390 [Syntrophobacteria bacterium]|nr:hypothetical protein [Syntrophobacteria bacterium]